MISKVILFLNLFYDDSKVYNSKELIMSNDNDEMNDDSVASASAADEHHSVPDINPPAARRQRII